MDKPLVSVIMSAYNAEAFIEDSIRSVLQQTYPRVELIICDDGSTDGTAQIIGKYPQVIYFHQNNQGQGAGRNNAVRKASGDFLAFIDADDTWLPEKLELQMPLFEKDPAVGAVYSDMVVVDPEGKVLGYNARGRMKRGFIFNDLLAGNYMCGLSSLVVRKPVFWQSGGFSNHRYCQDFVFLLRVAHQFAVDFCEQGLVRYLSHDDNISKKIDISYPEQLSFYKDIPRLYDLNSAQQDLVRNQLKFLYFSYAILHFRKKNFAQTAAVLAESKRLGLLAWKSRILMLLNRFPFRNLAYNKI
jgi:glycosyltransferase involved in cell wall biosynthesis